MGKVRNILFIMCDQFRADHLGCAGHPTLKTPNLDALAKRGVLFPRAYVQSGVCGPSRMSYYTGRYVASHGATWNRVPLSVAEPTIGNYLEPLGMDAALAGKTHMLPDLEGMQRFGIDPASEQGLHLAQGAFLRLDRYDGHHKPGKESGYPDFLRANGYVSDDPWSDFVISAMDPATNKPVSGWNMRNVHLPSRVKEEHSETAYMTDQAISYIEGKGEAPWFLHLSYVKPHWPYMAPAPYHNMYGENQILSPNRTAAELESQHPVLAAYRRQEECVNFARDEVVRRVRPAYMGLIAQLDHHIGRLMARLKELGRLDDTLIFFTADHGDYLGDHWLGEKEIFYEEAQRIPFIVVDPDPQADATRGTVDHRFVEAIDVLPTSLDALGLAVPDQWIEGRSLLPLTRQGKVEGWRDAVFSELDYGFREARKLLGREPRECRAMMVRTDQWKYVHWAGYRPQLFNLLDDPSEMNDLGAHDGHEAIRREMRERLLEWLSARKRRVTVSEDFVSSRTAVHKQAGVFFGQW